MNIRSCSSSLVTDLAGHRVRSFVFVARHPVWAAYIFLATQPFIGGIDRGSLIPLLRPSEALQFFLTAAVLAGVVVRAVRGERLSVRFTRLDRTIVVLCVLASIWPLFWMFARHAIPTSTDFFSTIVMWRLAALYALFRWVVKHARADPPLPVDPAHEREPPRGARDPRLARHLAARRHLGAVRERRRGRRAAAARR